MTHRWRWLVCLALAGCSFQLSEVAEITARDATRHTDPMFPTAYTRCEAHVPYTVDGETQTAVDYSELSSPGQSAESCPFEVGQSALVWVGSTPKRTEVFTTSGRNWFLVGGLFLLPVMAGVRIVRGVRSRSEG